MSRSRHPRRWSPCRGGAARWILFAAALLAVTALVPGRLDAGDGGGGLLPGLGLSHAEPTNSLRIPSDIPLLKSNRDVVEVPIYIRHDGRSDALYMGLDYDELLLQFEGWSLHDGIATRVEEISGDPNSGRARAIIEFDPFRAVDREEVLIWGRFRLVYPLIGDSQDGYGYRRGSTLDLREGLVRFVPIGIDPGDVLGPGSDVAIIPDQVLDGSFMIFMKDMIELGSGQLTPDLQTFRIPVYVTHLEPANVFLTMGLDYDELYLTLVNAVAASDLVAPAAVRRPDGRWTGIEWTGKRGQDPATITVHFVNGEYPALLREHLLDVEFELNPANGPIHPGDTLTLTPVIIPDPDAPDLLQGGGQGAMELFAGKLYLVDTPFLRGDADGSGAVGVGDVLAILDAAYRTGSKLPCAAAADVNGSGGVDLTDAVYLLQFIFRAGPTPIAPYPEVGAPPPDLPSSGCVSYGPPYFELLPRSGG